MKKEFKTLAELSKDGCGHYGIAASAVPYSSDLFTYLRITDINDDGTLNKEGLKSVKDDKAKEYLLCPNDIVFARTGASTGRSYFYDGKDGELVFAGFLIKFSLDSEKVNPKYVRYYCLSKQYADWVNSVNTGSTRGNINAKTFGSMPIPIISRKQQDKFVSILSVLDEKIEVNTAISRKLEEVARIIIDKYCKETEVSLQLSQIMSFENGFAFQSKSYLTSGTYKIITIKNVQDGRIDSKDTAYINDFPPKMRKECLLKIGDVILSLTGNVGRTGIVYEDNLLLNQRVAKLVPNNKEMLPFLYFMFRQKLIKNKMENLARGTAQPNLSPIETLNLRIPYDEISALEVSHNLYPIYVMIINNSQQNIRLSTIRDALLPRLLSGEIDVSSLEI